MPQSSPDIIDWHPDIAAARKAGAAIVALESSVLAQGLPAPANREAHRRMCDGVRAAGAVPAVTAVAGGRAVIGLEGAALERFLTKGAKKVSARDLGTALAAGQDGSTTVAGALAICSAAGLHVFATGGIGGVHRATHAGAPLDESADLLELARTDAVVVCAGAKAILDLPATLERLESYGIAVVGYRTGDFPGFFTAKTGLTVPGSVESARDAARAFLASRSLGRSSALLVVQPPPAGAALDPGLVEDAVRAALEEADAAGVRGGAVTPFLLAAVERATGGRSVTANLALLEANARLAGDIAVAMRAETG
jgi:pseudouridine-5'-phosphate glycosidase